MNDFFANIYELIPIGTDFNNDLYEQGAYALPGSIFLFVTIIIVLLYYLGLRGKLGNPRYRTQGWLIGIGLGWAVISGLIGSSHADNRLPQAGTYETLDYILFGLQTAIGSIIIYALFCFIVSLLKLHSH